MNAVAPTLTDTELASSFLGTDAKREAAAERNPLKRVLSAEEVASTAAYLLGTAAAGVTGQVWKVDAGTSALR